MAYGDTDDELTTDTETTTDTESEPSTAVVAKRPVFLPATDNSDVSAQPERPVFLPDTKGTSLPSGEAQPGPKRAVSV
jgi:hypothetical protein